MIGRVLGSRYELIEKIGEGGMAQVYKAKCHLLNRYVAVKILKAELAHDESVVKKFKAEAISVAKINSLNIVNIYDVGTEENINYIVMELVEGKTLKVIVKEKGRLSNEEVVNISMQIANALECAHSRNIIHRDIKPHNILVTNDGVVKVADFGIAKVANEATMTNTAKVLGSAHYFSPEQAKGSIVDGRTDIYSLGIVMYEMITGRVPYDAENVVSVALKHLQEQVIPPININPSIPENLNNLILRCLEKDPINRYQSAKEILSILENIKRNREFIVPSLAEENEYTSVMTPLTVPINNKKPNLEHNNRGSMNYEDDDYEDDDDDYEEKKALKNKMMIGALIAVLILAIGGFATVGYKMFFGGSNVASKEKVTIPTLIGYKSEDAEKILKEKGFTNYKIKAEKSEEKEGFVIGVYPPENTEAFKDAEITVTVSGGLEEEKVEDYTGWDIEHLKTIFKSHIFKMEYKEEFDDKVEKGKVISQDPKGGTMAPKGSVITFVISKGPEKAQIKVPEVRALTLDKAEAVLLAVGLKVGELTPIETDKPELDNLVSDQSIEPNTMVDEGTKINLVYHKYVKEEPKQVQVPDFFGKTVLDAKIMAEEAGVTIKFSTEVKDTDIVVVQDKQPGSMISVEDVVKLEAESTGEESVGEGSTEEGSDGSGSESENTGGGN